MKKKLFSIIMALALFFGLGTTAVFATGDVTTPAPVQNYDYVIVNKEFNLVNPNTTLPNATFSFTATLDEIQNSSATTAPAIAPFEIAFSGNVLDTNATNFYSLDLPAASAFGTVGTYIYKLQETVGNIAGVTYDGAPLYLVVYVIQDPTNGLLRVASVNLKTDENIKTDSFTNTYSAGNLAITKTVEGNLGQRDRDFNFSVTFEGPTGKTIPAGTVTAGGAALTFDNSAVIPGTSGKATATTTFTLKHDEIFTISNLPYGVTYTVTETDANVDDYTTTYTGATGTVDAATETAGILNHKDQTINTGVSLDNLPYILLLVAGASGLVFFVIRKKFTQNK